MKYLASGHQQPSWWLKPGIALLWRHNGHDGLSNDQPLDCLLNRSFRCRSKKTSKLRITGLCAGNSPVTGEILAQKASNAENVSFWWCHHDQFYQQHVSCNLPSLATEAIHYIWYKGLQLISRCQIMVIKKMISSHRWEVTWSFDNMITWVYIFVK